MLTIESGPELQTYSTASYVYVKAYSLKSKFHYFYLTENLLKGRSPTIFEQVWDKVTDKAHTSFRFFSAHNIRRAGCRPASGKIGVMEFGLKNALQIDFK